MGGTDQACPNKLERHGKGGSAAPPVRFPVLFVLCAGLRGGGGRGRNATPHPQHRARDLWGPRARRSSLQLQFVFLRDRHRS